MECYQKSLFGVVGGQKKTQINMVLLLWSRKREEGQKNLKNFLGAQIFDFTKENSFFENFLRNFFKNFRKKTCISKNIGI